MITVTIVDHAIAHELTISLCTKHLMRIDDLISNTQQHAILPPLSITNLENQPSQFLCAMPESRARESSHHLDWGRRQTNLERGSLASLSRVGDRPAVG